MKVVPFALFDDHVLAAHAWKRLLLQIHFFKFLFKTTSKNVLLQSLSSQFPELLFVSYPFATNDSEYVIETVRKKYPAMKIIVLTNITDTETVLRLVNDGANCILPTSSSPKELCDAASQIIEKEYCFNELFSKAMLSELKKRHILKANSIGENELTETEIELINDLYREATHKEIAAKRNLSPATIDSYISKLIHKVEVRNSIGLVKYGLKHRLIRDIEK